MTYFVTEDGLKVGKELRKMGHFIRGRSLTSRTQDYRDGWAWARRQITDFGEAGLQTIKDECDVQLAGEYERGALAYVAQHAGDAL